MAKKYIWIPSQTKASKQKVSEVQKEAVNMFFEPLVLQYKKELQKLKQNKEHNYIADIYSKWHQNYFYLCEQYKSENENRISDEYARKYLRLEFISENNFNFSYFRHISQWHLVAENVTLAECLKMINENPNFRPLI